jgi:hypothetical protein
MGSKKQRAKQAKTGKAATPSAATAALGKMILADQSSSTAPPSNPIVPDCKCDMCVKAAYQAHQSASPLMRLPREVRRPRCFVLSTQTTSANF